ncbi:MAG: pyrroline-5-carboxylate reductase [Mycobacterium sp.]|nr:pyrroline-5-carboxylate reductase [Mycobacterium sp.]
MVRIAIVGGGGMGEALLAGLLKGGRQVKDLVVAERMQKRAEYLAATYSVLVAPIADAVENASYIVVAVKPADVESVVSEIADAASRAESSAAEQVLVSAAAGVTTGFYEARMPAGFPVIRAMPNAPALVGAGVTALAAGRFATDEQLAEVAGLFERVGSVLKVSESQLDAVTAVSGSGPAYFFLFVEALVDAAVASGLSRSVATELAAQTMAGAAEMLLERMEARRQQSASGPARPDTTAAELRAVVTSAGGTTAAGLRELERGGLRAAVAAAVEAAKTRSEQLGITTE